MEEAKKKSKKIKITKEDKYEGQQVIDYLISSMEEINQNINSIHIGISEQISNNKNIYAMNQESNIINEKFNKEFKTNKNNMYLFEHINNINKNHIKKYKTILKHLNLNLILEKKVNNLKENTPPNQSIDSTFLKQKQIKDNDIIKENDIIPKNNNLTDKNNKKEAIMPINKINSFQVDIQENNLKNNNNLKPELKNLVEQENKGKNESEENNSLLIIDYKDNINYERNNNQPKRFRTKKFIIENDDQNIPDLDNEDNDIIINENDDNDDIISHINYKDERSNIWVKEIKNNSSDIGKKNTINLNKEKAKFNNNFEINNSDENQINLIKESKSESIKLNSDDHKDNKIKELNDNLNKTDNNNNFLNKNCIIF